MLGINGVGPETADSILLYAGALPTFVVDAYTYRIFSRHGWIDLESDYHQIQEYFHDHLPADAAMFNEFHALLVHLESIIARRPNRVRDVSAQIPVAARRTDWEGRNLISQI